MRGGVWALLGNRQQERAAQVPCECRSSLLSVTSGASRSWAVTWAGPGSQAHAPVPCLLGRRGRHRDAEAAPAAAACSGGLRAEHQAAGWPGPEPALCRPPRGVRAPAGATWPGLRHQARDPTNQDPFRSKWENGTVFLKNRSLRKLLFGLPIGPVPFHALVLCG